MVTFQKWANHLDARVVEKSNVEHDAGIVAALFSAIRYINDGI